MPLLDDRYFVDEDGMFNAVAGQDYKKGEQIFASYGKANKHHLIYNGYVPKDNLSDRYDLEVEVQAGRTRGGGWGAGDWADAHWLRMCPICMCG